MRHVDIEHWRLFVQVAEVGSLTKAAALRDTAQPVLSRQIAHIERVCGERLFDRTGRGVLLTEAGRRVLPRVKAWLNEADQLVADIRATAGQPFGVVRVGVLPSAAPLLVSLLYQQVRVSFPGIQLRISEASSMDLAEWLRTGQVDIALLFRSGTEMGPDDVAIAPIDTLLVGPPEDPATCEETIDFARLDRVPLILLPESNSLRRLVQQAAHQTKVRLNVVMECDSIAAQREAVMMGGAHCILGSNAVAQDLRLGRLRASKIVSPAIQRTITLCLSSHRLPTRACREVASILESAFPAMIDTMNNGIKDGR